MFGACFTTAHKISSGSDKRPFVGEVKLALALAELGLIDEYEFVAQPRLR